MNTTPQQPPLELKREDLFVSPIYRGNDTSWLTLDKECDTIIDKVKKSYKEKLQKNMDIN